MDRELEATFIEAMDALEAGEPVEAILERYPRRADELRPLLETAAALSSVPVAYSVEARQTSREAFLSRAAGLRERWRPAAIPWWRRFALAFGSLALLLIIVGGLLVGPAGTSLPGDTLYALKLAGEEARLALAGSSAQRHALRERYRRERVSEINALLALGRAAEVSCYGTLRAIEDDVWQLEGLRVEIRAETEIVGQPRPGSEVEGVCRVANDRVTAVTMRVASAPELLPTPTPTVTVEPAATETLTPGITPTPSLTPTPTESLTPPATFTSTPPPAGAPADEDDDGRDDDGGEDGDDGNNDGGGSDDAGDDDEGSDDEDGDDGSDDEDGDDDDGDDEGGGDESGSDDDGADDDDDGDDDDGGGND